MLGMGALVFLLPGTRFLLVKLNDVMVAVLSAAGNGAHFHVIFARDTSSY